MAEVQVAIGLRRETQNNPSMSLLQMLLHLLVAVLLFGDFARSERLYFLVHLLKLGTLGAIEVLLDELRQKD